MLDWVPVEVWYLVASAVIVAVLALLPGSGGGSAGSQRER